MLELCGYNEFFQLGEESNNQSTYKTPTISPSLQSHLDISTILSYSALGNHSIFITSENKLYAIGDNSDNRISGFLPKKVLNQYTEFNIKDADGHILTPVSLVCGKFFTLYMLSIPGIENKFQLALSYKNINSEFPLFLSIDGRLPVSLFGGYFNAAAIDSEGGVIFVNFRKVMTSPTAKIETFFLPGNEKAVSVACCKDFIFVIGMSGRLFQSPTSIQKLEFSEVSEFCDIEISEVSGSFWHCFAVCKDGRVFGWGANFGGRLGLCKEIEEVDKFTEIESLSGRNIVSAFAGSTHSLFLASDGSVLSCGSNTCGELFLNDGPSEEFAFSAVETTVKKDAVFCVAGDCISEVFIGNCPPNCPNMKVKNV